MTQPLTRELITFLNAVPDKASALRWIAANLSPADQNKLTTISKLPPDQALRYIATAVPVTPAPKPAPPKPTIPIQINEAGYAQQKSDISHQYGAQLAASDYARTIAQQRGSRQIGDFNVQATNQRNSFDSPYLQRGVFRSGIRQQGLTQLHQAQSSALGQIQQQNQSDLGQIAMQRATLQQQQQAALNAVDRARQQAIYQQLGKLGS